MPNRDFLSFTYLFSRSGYMYRFANSRGAAAEKSWQEERKATATGGTGLMSLVYAYASWFSEGLEESKKPVKKIRRQVR